MKINPNRNRVKCLRLSRGYSTAEFAEKYNVTENQVNSWESFESRPNYYIALQLSEDFRVSLEFIYHFPYKTKISRDQWNDHTKDQDYDKAQAEGWSEFLDYRFSGCIFSKKFKLAKNLDTLPSVKEAIAAGFNGDPNDQILLIDYLESLRK